MRKRIKLLLTGIACIGFMLPVNAQQAVPLRLSLDSAVVYAIDHNRTLINSKYAISKSEQQIKETIAAGLPKVDASMDYNNFMGAEASLQMNPMAPPVTIEFNPTSNFKASASQMIFNGNYFVGVQLSKLAKQITEKNYYKNELDVKEKTIQAYYMILVSEQVLKIIKENRDNAQTIYTKTKNMADAGMVESTDAKKLSVMVTGVNNAYRSAERRLQLAYNLLRLQLGLDPGTEIELTSELDEIEQKAIVQSSIETDTFNIENNIDYQLISMQGSIAEKQIKMQKASYLPSLVAFYSHTEKLKKPKFDMTPKNILGLTLNIPVFAGGERKAKLNQAQIDYEINLNTKDQVSQQLNLTEIQLMFNYKNLLEQYENQSENVSVAKEVLDQMNLKLNQGIVSSLELTSANDDYLKAQSERITTLLNLLNAELALRKLYNNL